MGKSKTKPDYFKPGVPTAIYPSPTQTRSWPWLAYIKLQEPLKRKRK